MSVNKAILVGRVGKPVEVRTAGESKVASFSLATTEKYKDSKTGEWKENTEWHNIVCWRNTAELAEKYIKKGTQLFIEGKLRTRSWDKDGEKRYVTEIVAENIQKIQIEGKVGVRDCEIQNAQQKIALLEALSLDAQAGTIIKSAQASYNRRNDVQVAELSVFWTVPNEYNEVFDETIKIYEDYVHTVAFLESLGDIS